MAKYVKKTLSWTASLDTDVVEYKVYVATGSEQPDYDSTFTVVTSGNLAVLPFSGMPVIDGTYKFGISAVDDFGNESDMALISADLDFLAPSPPTGLIIS